MSAPFISNYGVHIVKYMGDVPEGPLELTDALKESIRADLLSSKQSDAMTAWQDTAKVEYTGILKSIDEIQAASATDAAATEEAPADTAAATDTAATEPTATPAQ